MEALGPMIRRRRRRLGLSLDELAGRSAISKPYLSLIENGRVVNPPSDEKLRRLELSLEFTPGELLTQAHFQRTPRDVRLAFQQLMQRNVSTGDASADNDRTTDEGQKTKRQGIEETLEAGVAILSDPLDVEKEPRPINTFLQELVAKSSDGLEQLTGAAVPVINRPSGGYPKDFSDLSYPARIANEFISCPDVTDREAFAVRVHGDSMTPRYRDGDIVVFSPAVPLRNGDDCFVRFCTGRTTFKRVFFESERGSPVLRLQPRNERYRPQTVPTHEILGLHKAVYRYERVEQD